MFKVTKFDKDNEADSMCEELFSKTPCIPKKQKKIKTGRITKKLTKNTSKDDEKLKNEIRNILNQNSDLLKPPKVKTEKKRRKTGLLTGSINQKNNEPESQMPSPSSKKAKQKTNNPSFEKQKRVAPADYKEKKMEKLRQKLMATFQEPISVKKQKSQTPSLRERMMAKLQAARFRFINEQIYSTDSKEAQKIFKEDPEAFTAYHEGYRQQVCKWPLNPLDVIIKSIKKLPKTFTVADFGCGDAKLAETVPQKVHSFDLVAINNRVVACDMAHVPLEKGSVDVVVFCLSLMGTNLHDYLLEANRVLKLGGILKIAEVESRFDEIDQFVEAVQRFRFKNTWKDFSHNLFYFLDFKKESDVKNKKKLPTVSLHPCLYKKR